MLEKCPVCKNDIKENDKACSVCGFADLHKEFITKEDGELWVENVVEPYRKKWNLDEPEEIRELRRKADSGDAIAQANLGTRYFDGKGVKQDYEKALYWYRKSAEQGETMAQYLIGVAYEYGTGVPKDYKIAAEWKEKAANAGNANAQRAIGFCYQNGKGVQKDETKAVYWYKKAAEQGQKTAQNNLGMCYQNGTGVAKDINMAIYYYEQAIENGSDVAAHNLASIYDGSIADDMGDYIYIDYDKAFKYYKLAEERGYSSSYLFNNLGVLYADGKGVEKNCEMARKYYEKAIAMGNSFARENLDRLSANAYKVQNNSIRTTQHASTNSPQNQAEGHPAYLIMSIIGAIVFLCGFGAEDPVATMGCLFFGGLFAVAGWMAYNGK